MALEQRDLKILEEAFSNALKSRGIGEDKSSWLGSQKSTPSQSTSTSSAPSLNVKDANSAFGSLASSALSGAAGVAKFAAAVATDMLGKWQHLSDTGANFSNDLIRMSAAIAGSRTTFYDFADTVRNNSKNFTALGSNVTRGTEAFSRLAKEMHDSGVGDNIRNLGYTAKEANDLLALQVGSMRTSMQMDEAGRKRARDSVEELSKQIDLTSKLTGKSRQEQMDEMKSRNMDASVAARLKLETRGMSPEEAKTYKKQVMAVLADASSKGMGDYARERYASGTGPMTERGRMQAAMNMNVADAYDKQFSAVKNKDEAAAERYKEKAAVETLKNQDDPTRLALTATADLLTGGVGDALKENYLANRSLSEAVDSTARSFSDLGVAQKDYAKALKLAIRDAEEAQRGRAPEIDEAKGKVKTQLNKETGKLEPIYKDVGGVAKLANAVQITGETLKSTAASLIAATTADAASKAANGVLNAVYPEIKNSLEKINKGISKGDTASVTEALEKVGPLAEKLGVAGSEVATLVSGVKTALNDLVSAFTGDGAKVQVTKMPEQKVEVSRQHGSAGTVGKLIEDFGQGTLAVLHGREGVVTEDQLKNLAIGMQNEGASKAIGALQTAVPKVTESEKTESTSTSSLVSSSYSKSSVKPAVEKTSYASETITPRQPRVEQAIEKQKQAPAAAAAAVKEAAPTNVPKFNSDADAFISKQTQFGTDAQKAAYKELMSLTAEQTKAKKEGIQSEIAASIKAGKAASDARDQLELKLHEEGKGIAQATAAEKQRYAELTADMSAAHGNTQKLRAQERMFEQVASDKAHAKKMFGIDFEAKAAEKASDVVKKASDDSKDALIQTAKTATETASEQKKALEDTASVATATSKDIQASSEEQSKKLKADISDAIPIASAAKKPEPEKASKGETPAKSADDIFKGVPKNIADAAKFRAEKYTTEELESKKAGYDRRTSKESELIKEKELALAEAKKQFETAAPGTEKNLAKLKVSSGEDELRRMKEAHTADLEQAKSLDLAIAYKKEQETLAVAPKEVKKEELPKEVKKEEPKPVAPTEEAIKAMAATSMKSIFQDGQQKKAKFSDLVESITAPFANIANKSTSSASSTQTETKSGTIADPAAAFEALKSKVMPGMQLPTQVQPTGEAAATQARAALDRTAKINELNARGKETGSVLTMPKNPADMAAFFKNPLSATLGIPDPAKQRETKPTVEAPAVKPKTQKVETPKPAAATKGSATLEDVVKNLERLNTQMSELINQQAALMRKQIKTTAANSDNVLKKVTS